MIVLCTCTQYFRGKELLIMSFISIIYSAPNMKDLSSTLAAFHFKKVVYNASTDWDLFKAGSHRKTEKPEDVQ